MLYYLFLVFIIILDQYSKILAVKYLKGIDTLPVIKNIFHLTYAENTGAAFSILRGNKFVLVYMTTILLVLIFFYFNKYFNDLDLYSKLGLIMILGGGVSNLIDRIRLKYVIDYFDFRIINFAIFNVADSFVVIGTIILSLVLYLKK